MKTLDTDTIDKHSWHLSPLRPEQVGDVAQTMKQHGSSIEEIGRAIMLHFQTARNPKGGTTVFTFAWKKEVEGGIVVVTENGELGKQLAADGDSYSTVVKRFGLPDHPVVDKVIDDEIIKRGATSYTTNAVTIEQ